MAFAPKMTEQTVKKATQSNMSFFQAKLTVNEPGDEYEQEADAVADKVMRMPNPATISPSTPPDEDKDEDKIQLKPIPFSQIFRKCADCEEEEKVQRKESTGGGGQTAPSIVNEVIASSGKSLDGGTQQFMESRMGHDFSHVQVHTDGKAAESATAVNALAYTLGNHIVFNSGQYAPDTEGGKRLLAHELVHVGQESSRNNMLQRDDIDESVALRERLLIPFRGNDSSTFISRLRSLSVDEALILLDDADFWREMRTVFRGSSLWVVFSIIYFNNRLSSDQRRLSLALGIGTITQVMDALSIIIADQASARLLSEQYWNILMEVILTKFEGHRQLSQLFRMLILHDSEHSRPRSSTFSSNEVHYEETATGAYELRHFGGTRSMVVNVTQQEMRVVVRIRFVNASDTTQPYYFLGEGERGTPERWQSAIEGVWNNRFTVSNGGRTLQFKVSPVFVFDSGAADKQVSIQSNRTQKCLGLIQPGRENAGCWFPDTADTVVAHEFGHLLGANDEYRLPGSAAEITPALRLSLSASDIPLTTVEGITGTARPAQAGGYSNIPSLMNDQNASQTVYSRHISLLIAAFNASLPSGTPPYTVTER